MPLSLHKLEEPLKKMPAARADLQRIMSDKQFHGVISAKDAAALAERLGITVEALALQLIGFAQLYAVTPISKFNVGAVAVGSTGALYYGANLEVSGQALSFTVHAEQAAIANAWVNGEHGLRALAISAAPCGYCRQFLYELASASTLVVVLPNAPAKLLVDFLPAPFGPGDLGIKGGLMQPKSNGLKSSRPLDPVADAALAAANASYSPYTSTFAGVALKTNKGIYSGRYAENAAFNPSLSPLEAALSQLVLHSQSFSAIEKAVLVQARGRPASQIGATKAVLSCISGKRLKVCEF